MQNRAVCLIKVAMAGNTLTLLPRLATGMPIGAEVAAAEPAVLAACRREKSDRGLNGS